MNVFFRNGKVFGRFLRGGGGDLLFVFFPVVASMMTFECLLVRCLSLITIH